VVEVVKQLKKLTREETLNGGDTKVALEILQKVTFNDSLLPKNKSERQKLGQVSNLRTTSTCECSQYSRNLKTDFMVN